MTSKLEGHRIPYELFRTESWAARIDLDKLEVALANGGNEPPFEAVLTTHNETTTGRLHPIDKIGKICDHANVKLLVDAMSSFGADEIDLTHVDAIASSANKCLHGLPGLSF